MKELEFTGEFVVPNKTPYATYQEHINRYVFASNFVKDKTVLDIVCGTGYGSSYLARKGAKRVLGGDISKKAIEYVIHLAKLKWVKMWVKILEGIKLKNFVKRTRPYTPHVPDIAKLGNKISDKLLDKKYEVLSFKSCFFKTPTFIIAVAKYRKPQ